jgi:hypothetical protein
VPPGQIMPDPVSSVQDGRVAPRYDPGMSETIILPPGGGRAYTIGAMRGVFNVDEDAYCASEWYVEPGGSGPPSRRPPS